MPVQVPREPIPVTPGMCRLPSVPRRPGQARPAEPPRGSSARPFGPINLRRPAQSLNRLALGRDARGPLHRALQNRGRIQSEMPVVITLASYLLTTVLIIAPLPLHALRGEASGPRGCHPAGGRCSMAARRDAGLPQVFNCWSRGRHHCRRRD
jgi:hypothetical protein